MQVIGLDQFEDDPRLAAAIGRASRVLEDILGPATGRVAVGWGRARDGRGQEIIRLRTDDPEASLETRLTRGELLDTPRLEGRLNRFWGDVLQERSHKLLVPILQSIREHEGR